MRRRILVAAACSVALLSSACSSSSRDAAPRTPTSPPPSSSATTAGPTATSPRASATTTSTAVPLPAGYARYRAALSTPVEDPYYPQTSNPEVDTLHVDLDLHWDGTTLDGTATLAVRAMSDGPDLRLDLSDHLRVSAVTFDGKAVSYRQRDDGLEMVNGPFRAGSVHTLVISYRGRPAPAPGPSGGRAELERVGWTVKPDGTVYTFQEPFGAFTWYPVNDHPSDKAFYDAQITVPRGEVAVFNGSLVDHRDTPSGTTWRWHLDARAASYLTTIAIGPYTAYRQTMADGTPATYWALPTDRARIPYVERQSREAFDWLTEHAGPYPFDTVGLVLVGGNGGMETQTMVTLSRGGLDRPDAVIEHELAHQWFGDAVSPTDWQGLWLNEGWAMYMQQWYERDTGRYRYGGGIAHWRPLDNRARADYGPPGDYDPQSFASLNVYLGPALMLDAIRKRIGDPDFDELVKAWVADHEGANVDRAAFVRWLDDKTGERFDRLVATWLDSPTTPR